MKTILLVEDEALIAMTEAQMLKKNGYEVLTAYSARKAVRTVESDAIDLILMDIDLGPGKMDGTEAAQIIRKDHDLPIVFLSSHTEPEVVEKTEKITAYGYVVKNSGETVIINSIKMAFKLHNALQKEKEREKLMSTMIAASPVAIHGIDPDGNIIMWNESSEKIFGWKTDEVLGRPLPIVPEDKTDEHRELRKRTLAGETIKRREVIRCRKNGRRFYGSLSTAPLYNDKGAIFGIVAIMEDITERKKVEQELEEYQKHLERERDKFHALTEASPIPIVFVDKTGTITYANAQAEYTLEIEKSDSVLRTYNDPQWTITDFTGNHFPTEKLPFSIVSETKKTVYNIEHAVKTKSGRQKFLSINGTPLFDEQGEFDGMIAVLKDVTEKYEQDRRLMESEETYRSLFENMMEGCAYCRMIFDEQGNPTDFIYVDINEAFERLTALPKEEVVNKRASEVIPGIKDANPELLDAYGRVAATGQSEKFEIYFKPLEMWLNISVYSPKKNHFVTVFENITRQKETEEQLKDTIEKLNEQKQEMQTLYQASISVLEHTTFKDTAQKIFNLAKQVTGATAGYVALLSEDGSENEVLFLDDGGLPCNVDSSLSMPIRGLRAEAYHSGKAVVENDFMNSEWVEYMPEGHVVLTNVLFSPLPIGGKVVGVIGLANKEGGFTSQNLEIAEKLGTVAAIALKNSRSKELLREREASLTKALDEKQYLMKELNHRVKNNLAMISSLINLKDSALEKTELLDLHNQIEAIRIVHDKLYKTGEVTHIDFKDYISDLLHTIFSSLTPGTVHVEEDIENISLHTRTAVPLGIIINELATNAIKHGFTGEEEAKFTVMMNEDNNKNQYILTVSNTGRSFPKHIDLDSPGTLGLQLISALVDQIEGTIELRKEPYPMFTIRFPMKGDTTD